MNAVRLGALCALLLTASLARAQVEIPDTPVGRNVSAMLEALNSRDRDVVARYVADYGRGESVDAVMRGISARGITTTFAMVGCSRTG